MAKTKVKKMKKDKALAYLNGGDQACPHCGGGVEGAFVNIEGAEAVQRITCTDCGEQWNDIYKLAAVTTTDGELVASKAIPGETQRDETQQRYFELAKGQQKDGELEIDHDAVVSISEDSDGVRGAYVQAWIFVDNPDQH